MGKKEKNNTVIDDETYDEEPDDYETGEEWP